MRILYIGDDRPGTTSRHRTDALRRLGHEIRVIAPKSYSTLRYLIDYRTGYIWGSRVFLAHLTKVLGDQYYDLCIVNGGEWVGADTVRFLRRHAKHVIAYNNDDPFGGRDGPRWFTWLRSLPAYDAVCVVRDVNVAEASARGARRVWRVWMSCDEVAHAPRPMTPELKARWESEVAFVGTWMPERGPFLASLVSRGIPVAIWGIRWKKAPEWSLLEPYWRGGGIVGDDYAYALQSAKVVLGLVSKGNRDEYTTRTSEAPYLNAVLCAEDTGVHRQLFEHGRDAWLFRGIDDAMSGINMLRSDKDLRSRMAGAGRQRIIAAGLCNEKVMADILDRVAGLAKNFAE